jgi:alkylhydroperoxidase family enzyme
MSRIATIDPVHAPADVQATLAAVKAKIGMVPNLFSTFAQSSAVLNGYLALSDALGKGVLTARQREIISLAVAQANECHYCLSAHTLGGSSDHDMYIRNLRDSGYSPKNNFNASGNVGNAIASGLIIRLWERPVREPAEACVHRKSHPS